jgi:hypothetical protein
MKSVQVMKHDNANAAIVSATFVGSPRPVQLSAVAIVWADEDGDRQRRDGRVEHRRAVVEVSAVRPGSLNGSRVALQQAEADDEGDGATGELERADRDAEEGVPGHAQPRDDREGHEHRPERDRLAYLIGIFVGDAQERRPGGDRVRDGHEGREYGNGETGVVHWGMALVSVFLTLTSSLNRNTSPDWGALVYLLCT